MEQVCGGVVSRCIKTPVFEHLEIIFISNSEATLPEFYPMANEGAFLICCPAQSTGPLSQDLPRVAHLAT